MGGDALLIYLALIETESDKQKFIEIYDKYRFTMLHVAMGILEDQSMGEDAVHNAFLKVIKHLDKLEDVSCQKTKSWLVIIVKNCAIDLLRKEKSLRKEPFENEEFKMESLQPSPIEQLISKDGYNLLLESMANLDEIYKTVFELKYVHGYSINSIASMLDISYDTASQRLWRARKQLRVYLEKEGIQYE